MLFELHLKKCKSPDKQNRCINKHLDTCFICGEKNKLEYHHILRIPTVTIKVCHNCHKLIDRTNKYPHLKPSITRTGSKFVKWVADNEENLKKYREYMDLTFTIKPWK